MLDRHFHVLSPERPEVYFLSNQFLFGRRGNPCVDGNGPLWEAILLFAKSKAAKTAARKRVFFMACG
jgi:hypothetical protein